MQHVTNRIEWQQHNSCVPLGQDSAVYFKPCGCQWQMIVMSHLSISPLSSEDGRAVKQLHFAARPEACKRGEGKKKKEAGLKAMPHVWERWAHSKKYCDCVTQICWRACLVAFWELYHHLQDTLEKSWQAIHIFTVQLSPNFRNRSPYHWVKMIGILVNWR